jgi:CDP-glucose 4,6-dehydratase
VAHDGHRFSVVTARAGNVIGGGDWARDRIVTDVVRAITTKSPLTIRHPRATRPWQHVLDALSGYLCLAAAVETNPIAFSGAWNFGPLTNVCLDVEAFVRSFLRHWQNHATEVHVDAAGAEGEHRALQLDSTKAASRLPWEPVWDIDCTVAASVQWYREFESQGAAKMRNFSSSQIAAYTAQAMSKGLAWAMDSFAADTINRQA